MKAFQVHVNGRKLCTAGFRERDVVLSAIVSYLSGCGGESDELFLTVGGLISRKREHVRWIKHRMLRTGDEIRLKIIDTKSADSPRERHTDDNMPTPSLRQRKQYIRDMAKKWGWTITTRRSRSGKART
jgi:hypothetical protein